ncbi:hypothetical protein [Brachyspira intermedia]|nr:hypothetical protein [Brachyspira intermedia]
MKKTISILFLCFIFICVIGCYNYDVTGVEIENDGNENTEDNGNNEVDKKSKVFLHYYGNLYVIKTPTMIIISPNDNLYFYDGNRKMNIQNIQKISDNEYNFFIEYYYNGNIKIYDRYLHFNIGSGVLTYNIDEII